MANFRIADWLLPGLLGLAIGGIAMGVLYRPNCPETEHHTEPAATIELEDAHAAAWIAMDNGWIQYDEYQDVCADGQAEASDRNAYGYCDGTYSQSYRHGLLFQFGHSLNPNDAKFLHFDGVEITHDSNEDGEYEKTLLAAGSEGTVGTFDWLDVRASDIPCVIDPIRAYGLFNNTLVTNQCDDIIATKAGSPADTSCLRNRNVHASVHSDLGVLTYWTGPNQYSFNALESESSEHKHIQYGFELGDGVVVDRWSDGCFREQFTNVKTIRLRVKDDDNAHHSEYHMSPINGGSGGNVSVNN